MTVATCSFLRSDGTNATERDAPAAVRDVIDEFTELLGAARRLGLHSLTAIIVDGHCPAIGVSVHRRKDVVARVEDVCKLVQNGEAPEARESRDFRGCAAISRALPPISCCMRSTPASSPIPLMTPSRPACTP